MAHGGAIRQPGLPASTGKGEADTTYKHDLSKHDLSKHDLTNAPLH